jgi:excisionase family DNA binding protein
MFGHTRTMKQLITVEQLAQAMGWKPRTVYQKVWRRELDHIKVGRSLRFRQELVDELIERGTVPAAEAR